MSDRPLDERQWDDEKWDEAVVRSSGSERRLSAESDRRGASDFERGTTRIGRQRNAGFGVTTLRQLSSFTSPERCPLEAEATGSNLVGCTIIEAFTVARPGPYLISTENGIWRRTQSPILYPRLCVSAFGKRNTNCLSSVSRREF